MNGKFLGSADFRLDGVDTWNRPILCPDEFYRPMAISVGLSDEIKEAVKTTPKFYGRLAAYALMVFSFSIPLVPKLLPPLLIAVFASFLFSFRSIHPLSRLAFLQRPALTFSMVLYCLYLLGTLWSEDVAFATNDLVLKLPLLLLPLLFFIAPVRLRGRRFFVLAFILGCTYSVLLYTGLAAYRVLGQGGLWLSEITYSSFTYHLHPGYYSLYLCIAFAAWFVLGFAERITNWSAWLVPIVLLVGIILAGAKATWFLMPFLILFLVVFLKRMPRTHKTLKFMLFLMVGGAFISYFTLPVMSYRVNEFIRSMRQDVEIENPTMRDSTSIRKAVWESGTAVFLNNWEYGTGTGDIKVELRKEYAQRGLTHAIDRDLNAHSQILQVAISLGIFGLLSILGLFVFQAVLSIRHKDIMMVVFLSVLFLNFSVESMLEVQAGVLFFAWGLFVFSMRR